MRFRSLHRWNVTPAEAIALQKKLVRRIDTTPSVLKCDLIAGADVSYDRFSNVICASVVVWRSSDDSVVDTADAVVETRFPYVPGLLSFREGPALIAAFRALKTIPDVILFDGQGIAHPRRFGIASHIGLWIQRPSIGCGKTKLIGEHADPGSQVGATAELRAGGQIIGQVVRTKRSVKPVFVSPGHLVDIVSSVRIVQRATRGRRLPEPCRLAHEAANQLRRRQSP